MQQRLLTLIGKEMPQTHQTDRERLVHFLIGAPEAPTPLALASLIYSATRNPCAALTTLLHCELLMRRMPWDVGDCGCCDGSLQHCLGFISRCHELRTHLLDTIDHTQQSQQLNGDEHKIAASAMAAWVNSDSMLVHNYFHEMPVQARVRLVDVSQTELEVELTADLVRAFSVSVDSASISALTGDQQYVIDFKGLWCRDGRVRLMAKSVKPASAEKRLELRVKLEEPFPVHLSYVGQVAEARSCNLSVSGISLNFCEPVRLHRGESVGCVFELAGERLFLESIVCWVCEKRDIRAGLRFITLGPYEDILRRHLIVAQQHILSRIRNLPVPAWLGSTVEVLH